MFTDLFSAQAATYASIRPDYPASLFDFLTTHVRRRTMAWDCATGSGQAAVALAERFERVIATDASAQQLAHARPNPRIEYRVALAETSGLPDGSADLVTVAQALHWFDHEAFYAEVQRVLNDDGILAVWSYGDPVVDDSHPIDAALQRFNFVTVGPYWPSGRGLVGEGYKQIAFPFCEIPAPSFVIERSWTLNELAQYLRSWSACQRYIAEHAVDPVDAFERSVTTQWGDPGVRHRLTWPLTLRVGRKRASSVTAGAGSVPTDT